MTRMILKFIGWILSRSLSIVLRSIPLLWKALIFAILVIGASVGSLRLGVFKTVRKMADEWVTRGIKAGLPASWEQLIYSLSLVLAFLTLVAGWSALTFIAVFMVRHLF
jgi:hypothetical protein